MLFIPLALSSLLSKESTALPAVHGLLIPVASTAAAPSKLQQQTAKTLLCFISLDGSQGPDRHILLLLKILCSAVKSHAPEVPDLRKYRCLAWHVAAGKLTEAS